MRYTVRNWGRFQHYSGRRPPWIKLYRELLDNYEYMSLSLASKALAPLLWLLASESDDGSFEGEIPRLAFRLRIPSDTIAESINELIAKGFIDGASAMLAERKQVATPETERETERETPIAPNDSPNRSAQKVTWGESGFQIPDPVMTGFKTAYPAVAVEKEVAKAHAWALANPKHRKSQWGRFLNSWLQRAQDKARPGSDGEKRFVI